VTDPIPDALLDSSSAIVADALDALGWREQVVDPRVQPVFHGARLVGRAFPVLVVDDDETPAEPYAGEMDALAAMMPGEVGMYSVTGGNRAAAWGELFSCGAIGRGAVGALVDGCIRDVRQIEELGFPVFAAGRSPLDTLARARVAEFGNPIDFAGKRVERGDVVVADADGIVIVPQDLVDEVATFVASKHVLERAARDDLMAGADIRDVWNKYGVF
jgi:4-hydroxy-4-methyl-2-oxoglutarate aldolase